MTEPSFRQKRISIYPFDMNFSGIHPQAKSSSNHPNADSSDMSRWSEVVKCLRKYCDSTTLHGFKYLSEQNRPMYERIYWVIAISAVILTVTFVIMDQVNNFLASPVLISFDSKSKSVEEIPFPAVTICSDNQVRPSVINLTEALKNVGNLSSEMQMKFEYAAFMCKFNTKLKLKDTFDSSFVHEMLETTYGYEACKQHVPKLTWVTLELESPCNYLQPMVSVYGGCLSFNMLPLSHIFRNTDIIFNEWAKKYWANQSLPWSPDTGFNKDSKGSYPGPPPWKTVGSNMGNTVVFELNVALSDYDGLCSRGGKGFYVYIHNPAEMPGASHVLLYVEGDRDTTVSAKPKLYITDNSLLDWPVMNRGCYFQKERRLKFFKIYTQHNCELECEANYTLTQCGCVPFHYPRNLEMAVCGPAKLLCIETSLGRTGNDKSFALSDCNCFPSCSELRYDVRTTKATRYWSQDLFHEANESYSVLKVKFQTKFFIGIKRTIMFSFSDFVANVGGLLGLFLGFSILSVVEILYFVFFRPCTNLVRQRKLGESKRISTQPTFPAFSRVGNIGYPTVAFPMKKNAFATTKTQRLHY